MPENCEKVYGTAYSNYDQLKLYSIDESSFDPNEYLSSDNGIKLNVPDYANVVSKQYLFIGTMKDTEKDRGFATLTEAVNGSGSLWFNITVNSATDKNGDELEELMFRYHICNRNNNALPALLEVGSTTTVKVDVSNITAIEACAQQQLEYYICNPSYADGISTLNIEITPVYVMPDDSVKPTLTGDCNADGTINTKDVLLLRKHLANWQVEIDLNAADCNADGKVDTKDVLLMRKYLANWITSFPDNDLEIGK